MASSSLLAVDSHEKPFSMSSRVLADCISNRRGLENNSRIEALISSESIDGRMVPCASSGISSLAPPTSVTKHGHPQADASSKLVEKPSDLEGRHIRSNCINSAATSGWFRRPTYFRDDPLAATTSFFSGPSPAITKTIPLALISGDREVLTNEETPFSGIRRPTKQITKALSPRSSSVLKSRPEA